MPMLNTMEIIEKRSLPVESTPGDSHTHTSNDHRYDVYKLIELARPFESSEIPIASIGQAALEDRCWDDLNEALFSPKQFLDSYESAGSWAALETAHPEWKEHIKRVAQADLSHPILICKDEMLDGMHRLIRALSEGRTSILAKHFDALPDEALYTEKA